MSDDNVVNLRGVPVSGSMVEKDRRNEELIAGIKDLLAEAEAGRLSGGFHLYQLSNRDQMTAIFSRDLTNVELLGMSLLCNQMITDFIDDY